MLCSGSDVKFRQHLPVVLLIHVSAISREDVYPENNREALTNSASDPELSIWENEPNLHILGLSMDNVGHFRRIMVINICKCMHIYNCNPFEWDTHTSHAY